jgi:hypothetical protein
MTREVLAVKINIAVKADRKDYYEATRGNWRAAEKRVKKVEYVIGVMGKEVVSVFRPLFWETIDENGQKRRRFEGEEVDQTTFNTFKAMEREIIEGFGTGAAISYKRL